MKELRHMFVTAIFFAQKTEIGEDGKGWYGEGDKYDDPEIWQPPVHCLPLHWLFGEKLCEEIGLSSGEWGQPEYEEFGRWTYTAQGNAYNIPEEVWQKFADQFGYEPEFSEPNMGILDYWPEGYVGLRPGWRWCDGGEDWNIGGWSPVLDVSVSVTCTEKEFRANPKHFGFFELVEEGA
jgi:hypothetical protein